MRRLKYNEANIPEGMTVEVSYFKKPAWVVSCHLINADGKLAAFGMAICSPKDQPARKIGRAIAIGRALKKHAQLQENSNE